VISDHQQRYCIWVAEVIEDVGQLAVLWRVIGANDRRISAYVNRQGWS
jgi:hypothetical protein